MFGSFASKLNGEMLTLLFGFCQSNKMFMESLHFLNIINAYLHGGKLIGPWIYF